MKIPIDDNTTYEPVSKLRCYRIRSSLYFLSLGRILAIISTLIVIGCILLFCKAYIKFVLIWLEKQDDFVVALTICVLFVIVSLPISVGYIVLVLASGYLFGFGKGILLVICGANIGLLIAHNILRVLGHHPSIYKFTQNDTAAALMQVISGPLCFKIVFCSRLTPIPFGLQNTIFALSNVSAKIYHIASLFGLFPAQLIAVYVGSTLRSMQDVIENKHISSATYFFAAVQLFDGLVNFGVGSGIVGTIPICNDVIFVYLFLVYSKIPNDGDNKLLKKIGVRCLFVFYTWLICGATLIIWIGGKARTELMKVLAQAENSSGKSVSYSLV